MSNETFEKHRDDAPPGFFAWEATGLDWLRAAQDDGGPSVVGVRSAGSRSIVLDRLVPATATRSGARDLGVALARLHATGADGFGCPPPGWPDAARAAGAGDGAATVGWIGRQSLPLTDPASAPASWGAFYAQLRLRPYLRAARDRGRFDAADVALVERVCARLENGDFDDGRPPARLHGDLWGGNVVHERGPEGGRAVLIDPAAHGGHGETDLAMLALFGTEHLGVVEDAYAAESGLDRGWRERVGLHQLHPVLVHAVSHGPSYAAHALELARRYA